MTDHTMKAFDTDLQDLARMVAEMGGLAEKQVADSVDALAKRDTTLAQRVTAADANIDLIVMGTHGHTGLAHVLLGSVTEKVVCKAPCPVLTVRHPEHEFVHP